MCADAAGNTTAAIGKGFAIGSAALVSLALFGAYITRVKIDLQQTSILDPKVCTHLCVSTNMHISNLIFIASVSHMRADRYLCVHTLQCASDILAHQCRGVASSFLYNPAVSSAVLLSVHDPHYCFLACMQVFAGLLVGAMLPYWFSAMTMKSVGKAALAMVEEVRRQFNTIPGKFRSPLMEFACRIT
jgi:Na+/H+-translocating membrane pyrophosphatase